MRQSFLVRPRFPVLPGVRTRPGLRARHGARARSGLRAALQATDLDAPTYDERVVVRILLVASTAIAIVAVLLETLG